MKQEKVKKQQHRNSELWDNYKWLNVYEIRIPRR